MTVTLSKTKVRRLQPSIAPAVNAATNDARRGRTRYHLSSEQTTPPPPRDPRAGPHHARRGETDAQEMERAGLFGGTAGQGSLPRGRTNPQDGGQRLR